MSLCQYANAFGVPGEGLRQYRFFGFALIDIVLTILGGFLFSWLGGKYQLPYLKNQSPLVIATELFFVSIFLHWLFCVPTTLNVMLFGNHVTQ